MNTKKNILIIVALLTANTRSIVGMQKPDPLAQQAVVYVDQKLQKSAQEKAEHDKKFNSLPTKLNALSAHKDINSVDDLGNTRLHYAAFMLEFPAIEILITNGANPAIHNKHGQDMFAIFDEYLSKPKISQGIRNELTAKYKHAVRQIAKTTPSITFGNNENLLHKATQLQDLGLVKQLAPNTALLNAQTTDGDTPLHYVASNFKNVTSQNIIDLLLKAGANPELINKHGDSPLQMLLNIYLTTKGTEEDLEALYQTLNTLVDATKNINTQDLRGNTPLYQIAAFSKDVPHNGKTLVLIEKILHKGGNPNIQNKDGFTALHAAVNQQNINVVNLLLKHGANPHIRSFKPRTIQQIRDNVPPTPGKNALEMVQEIKATQNIPTDVMDQIKHIETALQEAEKEVSATKEQENASATAVLETVLRDLGVSLNELHKNLF